VECGLDRKIKGRHFLMHWSKIAMLPEWDCFGSAHRALSFARPAKVNTVHIERSQLYNSHPQM
jgi:hypothetical protein